MHRSTRAEVVIGATTCAGFFVAVPTGLGAVTGMAVTVERSSYGRSQWPVRLGLADSALTFADLLESAAALWVAGEDRLAEWRRESHLRMTQYGANSRLDRVTA